MNESRSTAKRTYIAFNKPYGVMCSFTDPEERETLRAYIPIPAIYPAGRLDYDSEGLLILTDDGPLIHHLTHPRHHLPKTYLVQVEGQITSQALTQLARGVLIKGHLTKRCQVNSIPEPDIPPRTKPVTPHAPTCWIRIVLEEGKKRQIRHMTAAVGFPTLRLVRAAIGPVELGSLQPGQWRHLTQGEIAALWEK